ncbi:MAG: sugar phosphate isomerase/epimerase [Elusimicrobiota bacterium]
MTNQPNNPLALSTAFNISKHSSWSVLLEEIISMGFNTVELNVEIPVNWTQAIEKSVKSNEVRISSLHNFCPRVEPLPEGRSYFSAFLPTADEEEERKHFIEQTKKTISFAALLGARAVVMHFGEVKTEITGRMVYSHVCKYGMNNDYFIRLRDNCLKDRRKNFTHYFDNLKRTINDIIPFAQSNGITVGFENRFHINEIPNVEETGILLKEFSGSPLAFWYDTGHAEIMKRMKLMDDPLSFLKFYGENLSGMHLHDFRGVEDHYAPGTGEIDFSKLKPFINNSTILVIEAHSKSTKSEVVNSIKYINNLLSA